MKRRDRHPCSQTTLLQAQCCHRSFLMPCNLHSRHSQIHNPAPHYMPPAALHTEVLLWVVMAQKIMGHRLQLHSRIHLDSRIHHPAPIHVIFQPQSRLGRLAALLSKRLLPARGHPQGQINHPAPVHVVSFPHCQIHHAAPVHVMPFQTHSCLCAMAEHLSKRLLSARRQPHSQIHHPAPVRHCQIHHAASIHAAHLSRRLLAARGHPNG